MISLNSFSQEKFEVFFDFNQDVPNENEILVLKEWIFKNPTAEILRVDGYCDSIDDNIYNTDLALKRINSVVAILKSNYLKLNDNIELKPFGKDFELSKKQEENRKVVFFYTIPINKTASIEIIAASEEEYNKLVENERSQLVIKFKKSKKGDFISIQNINFYLNSEKIYEKSEPLLYELYEILYDNPKLKIEIRGHICCNENPFDTKLSSRRAIVIFKYLLDNGIELNRLSYKGIGASQPIFKIPERSESERSANRRVEILIVDK